MPPSDHRYCQSAEKWILSLYVEEQDCIKTQAFQQWSATSLNCVKCIVGKCWLILVCSHIKPTFPLKVYAVRKCCVGVCVSTQSVTAPFQLMSVVSELERSICKCVCVCVGRRVIPRGRSQIYCANIHQFLQKNFTSFSSNCYELYMHLIFSLILIITCCL